MTQITIPVLFSAASLFSLWIVGILFYQGSVLFWNGRRSSYPALLAGLSLIVAGTFFVLHTLGLVWFRYSQLNEIRLWLPGALYLAALLSLMFLVNVAVSERRRPHGPSRRAPVIFSIVSAIVYLAFLLFDLLIPHQSVIRSLVSGEINLGLFFLGLACALPAGFAALLLTMRSATGDPAGRHLLKLGAYSLLILILITVVSWFLGWSGDITPLIMDILAQLCILAALIAVSQASVRYEVFSGHMPRLGMLRYFRKNIAILFLISALSLGLLYFQESIVWALILVSSLGFQSGYLEYRMMKDRERMLARMQSGSADLYQRLFEEKRDPAESVLKHLCEELGLVGVRSVAGGTYASILGHEAVRSFSFEELRPGLEKEVIALRQGSEQGELYLYGAGLTREEAEFARSTGERLLDAMALFQFSRILMRLQKDYQQSRKLTETMARRALHDDVLPEIHSLILEKGLPEQSIQRLSSLHRTIAGLLKEMPGYDNTLLKQGLLEGIRQTMGRSGYAPGTIEVKEEPDLEAPEKETVFYAIREILHNASVHSRSGIRISELPGGGRLNWLIEPELPEGDPAAGLGSIGEKSDGFQETPWALESPEEAQSDREEARPGSGQGLAIHSALLLLGGGGLETVSQWPEFKIRIFLS
ncbi:MAG TPA: hypothetical protein DEA96_00075 [Leptospiraceae bacterium]|nr:hypothetical protein [Spirochaetaceae bacterium]HBS03328.1 hypothetical protein [Leptospiraceae bacterium]|tara:strand:+ start:33125 stop:35065 length:1941 start_codon:yes stop_codon:yes gene_type:complete